MDDSTKKKVMIIVIVICVVATISIAVLTNNRGGSSSRVLTNPVQMLCINPECGDEYEISTEDFTKIMEEQGLFSMINPVDPTPVFTCPKCNEKSVYVAEKCKKCGEVFLQDYSAEDKCPDRCPECGYSKTKEFEQSRRK